MNDIRAPIVLGKGSRPADEAWLEGPFSANVEWLDVGQCFEATQETRFSRSISPNDIAYVMYTSGTTGKPKGVQITHEAAWNSIASHMERNPLSIENGVQARWFQFAASTFDPSIMEVFITLSSGATLCSASRDLTLADPEKVIRTLSASHMMATPGVASLIRPEKVPSLRSIWTMGETLSQKVIDTFASPSEPYGDNDGIETTSSISLSNAYGPTEAAINCTMVSNVVKATRGSIIGEPLSTCTMLVIDPTSHQLETVPFGFAGELVIGGPQLSIGYLNRPEANQSAFVTHPRFGRVYRTGDKARVVWKADGQHTLEFLGRLGDDQVKINGQRVELQEIDSILATATGVSEVSTLLHKSDTTTLGGEVLLAFVVATGSAQAAESSCRAVAKSRLPTYIHPSQYIFLSSLPRSASAKLDRRALASKAAKVLDHKTEPQANGKSSLSPTRRRRSSQAKDKDHTLEQVLSFTLQGVTGRRLESSHSRLVIDSLTSMRLLQRLRDRGMEELALKDLLHAKSVAHIAKLIRKRRDSLSTESLSGLHDRAKPMRCMSNNDVEKFAKRWTMKSKEKLYCSASEKLEVLPTTITQAKLLLSFAANESSTHERTYINQSVYHLESRVNSGRFRQAVKSVLDRHDIFRTQFVSVDDDLSPFAQCIRSSRETSCIWDDLQHDSVSAKTTDSVIKRATADARSRVSLISPYNVTWIKSETGLIFVLTLLHALFDYGSLQLLLQEIEAEYYERRIPSRTSVWEAVENHFDTTSSATDEYWSDYLEGSPATSFPQLTGLRPELASHSVQCLVFKSHLSLQSLESRSRVLRCSPLSLVQAAWSAVLFAYTGSHTREVTFGTVLANRLDAETEACMAPTFTVVPTRCKPSLSDPESSYTAIEFIKRLTEMNITAQENLHSRLDSKYHRKPVYDTTLALQVFATDNSESDLWREAQFLPMAHDYAVMMEVCPDVNGNLIFKATYTDVHLDTAGAHLMNNQMAKSLEWFLNHPRSNFTDVFGSLSHDLLSILNPTPSLDTDHRSRYPLIQSQFEHVVETNPSSPALVFIHNLDKIGERTQWTYKQLNDRSNMLAGLLLDKLGPLNGSIIPLSMEKRLELYVAVLGIVKAGGAWCPIDTAAPASRRRELIARTGSSILILAQESAVDVAGVPENVEILNMTSMELPLDTQRIREVPSALSLTSPSNPAYLIWTSGTTGLPKGVPVSHNAATTSMKAVQECIPGSSSQSQAPRCTQFSQHTFDVFVQDLFFTWGLGGTVMSATKEIMVGSFPQLVEATKATHAHLTPAFASGVSRSSCPSLEVITMIGEKLQQHVADDWGENTKAFNTYGPAEATVVSTLAQFGGLTEKIKSMNIGKPLSSISCYVLREESPVMLHGIGELAVGGHQLASGYYKDPSKSSEKFKWNHEAGELLYMTGDIVRMLANGTIEFIGREDDLVKLGGIRVELSEISFALRGCHLLAGQIETFQMSRPDRGSKLVVSFMAIGSQHPGKSSLLQTGPLATAVAKAALDQGRQSLPDFMVPKVILTLKEIPKTPSAKVDRKVLQSLFEGFDIDSWDSGLGSTSDSQRNLSQQEVSVLKIVSGLSGVPVKSIKLSSYLPSLGIDSLNAGRLTTRLRDAGVAIQISRVLGSRTIADLLAATGSKSIQHGTAQPKFDVDGFNAAWQAPVAAVAGLAQNSFTVMPASPMQEGLIGESISNKGSYWSTHTYKLDRSVSLTKLRAAWEHVADRTESLRTSFLSIGTIPADDRPTQCKSAFLQLIANHRDISWSERSLDDGNPKEAFHKSFVEIYQAADDNSFSAPPWAVTIFDIGSERQMMFTIHHALHDRESLHFLIEDLWCSYKGFGFTRPKRAQLRDCMATTLGSDGQSSSQLWKKALIDFSHGNDVAWPDLTAIPEHLGEKTEKRLLRYEMEMKCTVIELQEASQAVGVSTASIFRAAMGLLVLDYLEASSVVFGEIYSQRTHHPEIEDAIAPLVATLPVPFKLGSTVRKLLVEQEQAMSSIRSRQPPSGTLIRRVLDRPVSLPLYPAVFVFHHRQADTSDHTGSDLWQEVDDTVGLAVEHPFALNVTQGESWLLELVAESTFITQDHLQIMARQIDALVQAIVCAPDAGIAGLLDSSSSQVLSIARSKLLWPDSHPCVSRPSYWLERRAEENPQWKAIEVARQIAEGSTETESWTYETLNRESNRVAALIHTYGLRNKVVGMCAGRTLQSYACVAGILKSGNTYLPIDERLPQERKQFLLKDSACSMLLTDSQCIKLLPSSILEDLIVNLDDVKIEAQLQSVSTESKPLHIDPLENAYLLYTSGSTGRPKGVLVSHQSLCGFVEGLSSRMKESSENTHAKSGVGKWLGLASRAFDVHLAEMFLAWRLGLAAVTAPRETLLDDLRLVLNELKVTHAIFVPSLLEQAGLDRSQIPDVVFMAIGGEKLTKHIIDKWSGHPSLTVVNAYGPTELAIGCTASHIAPGSTVRDIGRPYSNSVAHVLIPDTFNYAKRGQSGELCFTGCLVGNGYLNRPDAKGFVDSFRGQRMYRTGDMVRMMADDRIEYLGRSDDQTKIRGQRIELAEVSETIRAASDVPIDVATLVLTHPSISASQLVTFVADLAERSERYGAQPVMSDQGERCSQLQSLCRERLPKYMLPDHIIPVSILPLAPISGKVDSKMVKAFFSSMELSHLLGSVGSIDSEDEPSRDLTPNEEAVKATILKVTKLDESQLVHNANLLRLGFDSLSIVGLILQLRKIGFRLSVASVLSDPTIEGIATRREEAEDPSESSHVKLVDAKIESSIREKIATSNHPYAVEKILPCLPLQESLVATTMNSNDEASYVNHMIFEVREDVDSDKFEQAWRSLVQHTPILRTSFHLVDDSIFQVVHKDLDFDKHYSSNYYPDITAARRSFAKSTKSISALIIEHLQSTPPWRCAFVEQDDGNSLVFLSLHHALYDGNSLELMLEDVFKYYHGQSVPHRTGLDALMREQSIQVGKEQEHFWKQYLDGYSSASVFDSKPNSATEEYSTEVAIAHKFSDLNSAAKAMKVTVASLLQTVFAAIVARVTSKVNLVFGAILSGRSIPVSGAETIVAPCIATIPQRVCFATGANDLAEIAKEVQKDYGQCLQYQHTPLRKINKWVGVERQLFYCLYSFNHKSSRPGYSDLMVQDESFMTLDYPFAVEFVANDTNDTLTANCTFTSAFGDLDRVQKLIEEMGILIGALCRGETIKISDLEITDIQQGGNVSRHTWSEETWNSEEELTRAVVAKLTGLEEPAVSKNVSFFRLGVDSISAIRLATNLRQAGLKVSSSDVMRYSCIGELCSQMRMSSSSTTPSSSGTTDEMTDEMMNRLSEDLEDGEVVETIYPCTPLQTGMITGTLVSGGSLYVHPHAVVLNEAIDLEKLEEAWRKAVEALDILRTSFHYLEDAKNPWFALIRGKSSVQWGFEATSDDLDSLQNQMRLEREVDFSSPPVKAGVLNIPGGKLFVVLMHHALYDGNSVPMLFDRIRRAYEDIGMPSAGALVPFSTAAKMIAHDKPSSIDFWLDKLQGFKPPGTDELSSSVLVHQIENTYDISQDSLDRACKDLGVTSQTIALVAFSKALSILLGQRDVVFGHVISGRSLPLDGVDDIVGPMFNTIPFRLRLESALQSNRKVTERVQDFTANAQDHQHAPLQHVQNAWRQRVGQSTSRLFDALFLFQKQRASDSLSNTLWKPYDADLGISATDYHLNIEVEQGERGFTIQVIYHEGAYSKHQMEQLLEDFRSSLEDIIAHPSRSALAYPQSLSALPLSKEQSIDAPMAEATDEESPHMLVVKRILSQVSGVPQDKIKARTNIFAIGLDSISAINVASKLRNEGYTITIAQVLQAATVAGVSQSTSDRARKSPEPVLATQRLQYKDLQICPVDESRVEIILPCLSGQNYHLAGWFQAGRTLNEATWAFRAPKLDLSHLKAAWDSLVLRHPILRTTFARISKTSAAQIILKPNSVADDSFHTSQSPTDVQSIKKLVHNEKSKPFDLSRPPVRITLLEGTQGDAIILTMNHALYDAWTLPLLLSDLTQLYKGTNLEPPPIFADCVDHVISKLDTQDEASYWKGALADYSPTILGHSRIEHYPNSLPTQEFIAVDSILSDVPRLQSLARNHNLSLPNIILLAFSRVLSRTAKVKNPIFGLYQAGRSLSFPEADRVSGPLLNMTPVVARSPLRHDTLAAALELQSGLQSRVPFEQSAIPDILEWIDAKEKVLFNTYVNVLWHQDKMALAEESMFEMVDVGLPTEYARKEEFEGETPVDGLEWPLAREGIFVDISLSKDGESVGAGARVEGGVVGRETRDMLRGIGREVEQIVDGLRE
ncbi:MAG: hypothetical protein MMC23_000232 [Stictis urceolatum]|nr:hypothetical protein [Stictis urceolata]